MFHDCGNEGNGELVWDNDRRILVAGPTGCDASVLFSKEQLSMPANQGRMVQTAEALFDHIYTKVNDASMAAEFMNGSVSGVSAFCDMMCDNWCNGVDTVVGADVYYSEDDTLAKPRDLPSLTYIKGTWCSPEATCNDFCTEHVRDGVGDPTPSCKVSMADVIQMAAAQGVRYTSGGAVDIVGDVQWGRCDADTNNALDLPDAFESSIDTILHAYPSLGNYRSIVALLGSHTIGKARVFNDNQLGAMNSRDFDLDETSSVFDNNYFKGITIPLADQNVGHRQFPITSYSYESACLFYHACD